MESKVPFPQFIRALKELGAEVPGAAFLGDPLGAWRAIDPALRRAYLSSLGIAEGEGFRISIGKLPGPKSIANILVVLSGPEAVEDVRDEPEETPEPAAAPSPPAPLAQPPAPEPAPEPAPAAEASAGEADGPDAPAPATAAEHAPADSQPEPAAMIVPETEDDAPAAHDGPGTALATVDDEAGDADALVPLDAGVLVAPDEGGALVDAEHGVGALAVPGEPTPLAEAPEAAAPANVAEAAAEPPAEPSSEPAAESTPEPAAEEQGGLLSLFRRKAVEAEPDGPVTEMPPVPEDHSVVEIYPVQEPYAYVRILYNEISHEHRYEVIEPRLHEREANILAFMESTIVDVIEVGLSAMTKEEAAELLRKHADEVIYDYSIVLTPISREKILYYILRDFLGFSKLDPIMRDEFIEDVSCDGPEVPVFLYHRKYESLKSTVVYENDDLLDSFVIKMAQRSGKHVSIAEPLLDATLPDGSRLNATLSDEVTAGGSTFTIRKFKEEPFTVPDLVRFGTMNAQLLAYWWLAVQNGASAIYAGGTASGKTTSLNAILLFIPPQMKIVSIEDTREINIPHENWIAGVTRAGFGPRDNNGRQAGEIDMFTLLKAALRQRPEYILVGEVRGQEATALFQAMATGHTAYGTMHADSAEAVIHRLESEPISIPRSLLEALDIVSIQIQTRIGDRRVRRTKELIEIVGLDPHTREILTNEVFTWSPASDEFEFSGVSYVLERIQIERNMSESDIRDEFDRRVRIIKWMVDKNIRSLAEVGRVIATYYRNPDAIMQLVDADADAETMKEKLDADPSPAPAAPQSLALVPTAEEEEAAEADAEAAPASDDSTALVEVDERDLIEMSDEEGLVEVTDEEGLVDPEARHGPQ